MTTKPSIENILKEPYTRILVPDTETGTFGAEILEFPGCVSQGDTPAEAYANLEDAAKSWLEATLEAGQSVPRPFTAAGYSGRFALRLPRGLHKQAAQLAELEKTSLNQFFVTAIAEKVGAASTANLYSSLYGNFTYAAPGIAVSQGTAPVVINLPLAPSVWTRQGTFPAVGGNYFVAPMEDR